MFYMAIRDDLNKKKAKLVTLFYRFWYIIIYEPESNHFIIIKPWLNLHKHSKYNSLLDSSRKAQTQLNEGLAKS